MYRLSLVCEYFAHALGMEGKEFGVEEEAACVFELERTLEILFCVPNSVQDRI